MLPLINRSVNSFGRSLLQVSDIVSFAKENNIPVSGLTDVHTLAGVPNFLAECEREGIHGVAGLTLQVVDQGAYRGELVLLAKGDEGFSSLKSLLNIAGHISSGDSEFNPKMGLELSSLLSGEYKDLLSHCIALDGFDGSLANSLLQDVGQPSILQIKQLYNGESALNKLKAQFSEGEYLAVQLPGEKSAIATALTPTDASDTNYTVVESTIAHAKNMEHLMATKQWFAMYAEKWISTFDETGGLKWVDELYAKRCQALPGVKINGNPPPFVNSSFFVERCQAPNVFSNKFRADMMLGGADTLPLHLSVSAAWSSFKSTLPPEKIPLYATRISEEIKTIYSQGFSDYFRNIQKTQSLADATNNGYMLRGSAVSSLVMHVIGMTPVDPVENGLLFKRFIDEARLEEPDADVEFVNPDLLLNDLKTNFGGDQIAVLSSNDGIKKAEKLLSSSYHALVRFRALTPEKRKAVDAAAQYLQRQTRMLQKPWSEFKEKMLDDLMARAPKNPGVIPALSKLIEISEMLSHGYTKASVNKGSIVIAPEGVSKYFHNLEIGAGKSGVDIPRIEMTKYTLAGTGLIKYDYLPNNFFKRHYLGMQAVGLDPYSSASYTDPSIGHVFQRGAHLGISQLGGFTGASLANKFLPDSFQQLTAMFALMRDSNVQGDNDVINKYVDGKKAPESVVIHDLYKNILGDTYGAMLYEEQLMKSLTDIGNFTWGKANTFRSRLKKGDLTVVADHENDFIEGAIALHSLSRDEASALYQPLRDKHGRFVFSKAHGCAYAHLAVQQCVFKCMYPAQNAAELYLDDKALKNKKKITLAEAVEDWALIRYGMPDDSTLQTAMDLPDAIKAVIERESASPLSTYKKSISSIVLDAQKCVEDGLLDSLLPSGATREQLLEKMNATLVPLIDLEVQRVNKNTKNPTSAGGEKQNKESSGARKTNSEVVVTNTPVDETVIPLNRRKGFIDWYKGVMPLQLLEFLALNRHIHVDSLDQAKAKGLDHIRFSFKSAKDGQVKKYHLAVVSNDPQRVKDRGNYDINFAMHQGRHKGVKGFYTTHLMAMLVNDGLTEDAPNVAFEGLRTLNKDDAKSMLRYYSKMAKASQYPLYGTEMLENSMSKLSISSPISAILSDLSPKARMDVEASLPEMIDKGRSIDSTALAPLFEKGVLSYGQRYSDLKESSRAPGTHYRQQYTSIFANFRKVDIRTPMFKIPFPEPSVLSPGGHQFIFKDHRKNKVSRIDHGTNNVKGHFCGDPKDGSNILWLTEGVFDAFAFNELQTEVGLLNIPSDVEPNAVSIKSANGGIALIQKMLGVEVFVDDSGPSTKVDFCLSDWNEACEPFNELELEDLRGWFLGNTFHWIEDGSQTSATLQNQLITLMQQSGLAPEQISGIFLNYPANPRNNIDRITQKLCSSAPVGTEPNHIIMHKGVMPQWLHMNNFTFAESDGRMQAFKSVSSPRKSELFSQMTQERKGEVSSWLRKQFKAMSGSLGLGLALDNDPAGRKEAITLAKFADAIDLPYQALMPKPKKYNLNGKIEDLKDHNDYLAVAKLLKKEHNDAGAHELLSEYMGNLTSPSRPLIRDEAPKDGYQIPKRKVS